MRRSAILLFLVVLAAGCSDSKTTPPAPAPSADSKAKSNLDQLSPADRALAEAQGVCPISKEPLGEMGTPIKLVLNGKPVFICCKNCEKKAKANPDETLKTVEALKAGKKKE